MIGKEAKKFIYRNFILGFTLFCFLLNVSLLPTSLFADHILKLIKKEQIQSAIAKQWILDSEDLLTSEQKQIINSGFDAFFTLQWLNIPNDILGDIGVRNWKPSKESKTVYEQSCKIKFDTWNERYNYALSTSSSETSFSKTLSKVEKSCIQHKIFLNDLESWNRSIDINSNFYVLILAVEQLDSEKSSQLKNWFIKQQNSMFQGIFAHMIGELKTAEFSIYAVPKGYFR